MNYIEYKTQEAIHEIKMKSLPYKYDLNIYRGCNHECKYCYASADFDKCDDNFTKHDPKSPLLIGWPRGDEKIIEMKPKLLNTNQCV